jgi:DNA-binding transcriptional regulator YiaG
MTDTQKPALKAPGKPQTRQPGPTSTLVRQTVDRLGLDETQAAAYFGVPVFTVRKWINGDREPGAAVARLLQVLGMLEAVAPALHGYFLQPAQVNTRKRGQPTLKNQD